MTLEETILHILDITSDYKDKTLLDIVIQLIPVSRIWSDTCASFRETQIYSSRFSDDESVLLEKLFLENFISWFKNEFFKWYEPNCKKCGKVCEMVRYYPVSSGQTATNTEVYECTTCQITFNFERFNDPYILLQTRQGRCSEFSQMFTVMCFAVGYEARFIYDTNDHAWTEVYSHLQGRWIHCDPSEGVIDKPLMYELGWGKKPKLIMSFSPTMEIQDVTWRYSQDHKGILNRREANMNDLLLFVVSKHNKIVLDNCSSLKKCYLFKRIVGELAEFLTEPKPTEMYSGRTSGPLEWREQRGEIEVPTFQTGFIFKLNHKEIKDQPKYYCMWYSSNCDTYVFYCNGGTSHFERGWKNCTYSFKNIIRKEELDWNQSYLARETGEKSGSIMWKFDLTNTDLNIDGISVKMNSFHVENGVIEFKAYNNENKISFKNALKKTCSDGQNIGLLIKSSTSIREFFLPPPGPFSSSYIQGTELNCLRLSPEKTLTVEVILTGGNDKFSWQQAQIARQSKSEGPTVSFGIVLFIS